MTYKAQGHQMLLQRMGLTNATNLFWSCYDSKNFGDWIAPILFEYFSGVRPQFCSPDKKGRYSMYFTVGSILHRIKKANTAIVWGSGIIFRDLDFPKPKRIYAVRGPVTRERCLELGYECPEVYGDPAVLLPMVYPRNRFGPSEPKLGVVPHMVDAATIGKRFGAEAVHVIDVCDEVETVVENICRCDAIASTSLHGIIIAHAYGIPAIWLNATGDLKGDGVKFEDYFSSLSDSVDTNCYSIADFESAEAIRELALASAVPSHASLQRDLLESCPFLTGRASERLEKETLAGIA